MPFGAIADAAVLGVDATRVRLAVLSPLRIGASHPSDAAMTIPAPAEFGRTLNAAPEWFRPFVALCAFAGLRLGDDAGGQRIQRSLPGNAAITPPKYDCERSVLIPEGLAQILASHVQGRRRPRL